MKEKKVILCIIMIVVTVLLGGCFSPAQKKEDSINVESNEENDERTKTEQEAKEKLLAFVETCKPIYSQSDKGEASNVVLEEASVHQMVNQAAEDGIPVTCGNYDLNMLNYENVHKKLMKAKEGEKTDTEFYEISLSGTFRYFYLEFKNNNLVVTCVSAILNEDEKPVIRQVERNQVYMWEYTEKGWLIWEKELSKNQEMDMHEFIRIFPLDEKCREIMGKYITPISYMCNNLFSIDWDKTNMGKIEFNDLYEFLYLMKTGNKLDKTKYTEGIPKEEFEDVIQQYFDITIAELEQYARYNANTGMYPWIPIGLWNRIQQVQQIPEVVECIKNDDGTWSVVVETIFIEGGLDCSFQHVVTMREDEHGNWMYLGNKINWDRTIRIPAYKSRREYEN